jgi:hypothetical protein
VKRCGRNSIRFIANQISVRRISARARMRDENLKVEMSDAHVTCDILSLCSSSAFVLQPRTGNLALVRANSLLLLQVEKFALKTLLKMTSTRSGHDTSRTLCCRLGYLARRFGYHNAWACLPTSNILLHSSLDLWLTVEFFFSNGHPLILPFGAFWILWLHRQLA